MGLRLSPIPLRLGPLAPPGFIVRRSGLRWLCEDGHLCRPGEAVAYCNIGLSPDGLGRQLHQPFMEEWQDVQAVLAPRQAGRIRRSETSSRGGFLDRLDLFQVWTPDFVLGHMEPAEAAAPSLAGPVDELDLFMVAGRRYGDITEGRQGLLTGWHDRSRAWRADGEAPLGAVLSLGTCEMSGVIRGENAAFLERFEAFPGPVHAIYREHEPLAPCARVLVEQIARTPAEYEAIAADLIGYLAKATPPALPSEWVVAGGLLNALKSSPLRDTYDVLSRTQTLRTGPVDAVVLSSNAEGMGLHIHRRLGYAICMHGFRIARAGPSLQAWVNENFQRTPRSLNEIVSDWRELIGAIRAAPGDLPGHVLILNRMSSSGDDDVQDYAAFDAPLGDTLANVYGKDVNLMLHDLAREPEVAIVDVDAIAADMGAQRNLPDGVHGSGALQAEVRDEVLHILQDRGVPGFAPAS